MDLRWYYFFFNGKMVLLLCNTEIVIVTQVHCARTTMAKINTILLTVPDDTQFYKY